MEIYTFLHARRADVYHSLSGCHVGSVTMLAWYAHMMLPWVFTGCVHIQSSKMNSRLPVSYFRSNSARAPHIKDLFAWCLRWCIYTAPECAAHQAAMIRPCNFIFHIIYVSQRGERQMFAFVWFASWQLRVHCCDFPRTKSWLMIHNRVLGHGKLSKVTLKME
jgi:hypothetical protein